ncbi:hypothetical protein BG53_07080 [Paenibacillus darwinianus]|uniref:Uncharacterized protein n=1 Tax=Paenibacillus darwinianus TaxID=1380763 RepID=A0A9W5W698_9BACL|nr:hypothetical protein [Paenibacillus darwinianus]EXX85878.1 hypothetical protein CH50_08450 [Paenibacillus darwinianus]EXX86116.1 hypothetical protein BG53_07080 [Paenibacillus darwinianus]EXX86217.1 hypothetical protein BG52_06990 [Paenibacillus darwinianus]
MWRHGSPGGGGDSGAASSSRGMLSTRGSYANEQNRVSKADVQSTELNKMPAGEEQKTQISDQA